jgi:hypothetical protein
MNIGLHDFGGHFSSACSNKSRALSSFEPPCVKLGFDHTDKPTQMRITYVSLDEFREINVPYLERNWEREQLDAPLVYFETFLEVVIFFEESSIVDNNLGICNTEFQDFVVHRLCGLHGTKGLFEIDVERPQFKRLEQSCLHRERLQTPVRNCAMYVVMKRTWSW